MLKIKNKIILLLLLLFLNSGACATQQQYNNYIQNAYKALKSGHHKVAIQNYNNALRLYPNEPEIYNNLGVAYLRVKDLTKAEICYKKAIRLNPSNAFAYSNLSSVCELNRRYAEAAKYLENYARLTPSDKKVYYHLGKLYSKAGNTELCLKNYEKSIQFEDDKFNTYCLMGEECKKSEDFDKAVYYYQLAISNSDNSQGNINYDYAMQELRECQFKTRLASVKTELKAPGELHELVTTNYVLKYRDTSSKLHEMIDLLWNDEDGKKLLGIILKNKIPIQIVFGGKEKTNAEYSESYKKSPLGYMSMVPLPLAVAASLALSNTLFNTGLSKEKTIKVNLGEDIIHMYKGKNPSYHNNMYALMAVIHEAGHAVSQVIENSHNDSIEEEMTVSMLGYNSASKILIGRPLTRDESFDYAKNSYKALMSDEHKSLPLYNNYRNIISKTGINLYNYDTYADLYRLQQEISH